MTKKIEELNSFSSVKKQGYDCLGNLKIKIERGRFIYSTLMR
jgi:hypothetical protein